MNSSFIKIFSYSLLIAILYMQPATYAVNNKDATIVFAIDDLPLGANDTELFAEKIINSIENIQDKEVRNKYKALMAFIIYYCDYNLKTPTDENYKYKISNTGWFLFHCLFIKNKITKINNVNILRTFASILSKNNDLFLKFSIAYFGEEIPLKYNMEFKKIPIKE